MNTVLKKIAIWAHSQYGTNKSWKLYNQFNIKGIINSEIKNLTNHFWVNLIFLISEICKFYQFYPKTYSLLILFLAFYPFNELKWKLTSS